MSLAPTLEGRLICACNCAYDASVSGILPTAPTDAYYVGAGFAAAPKAFVAGNQNIDACLVGTIPDGVVLTFRGTLTFNIKDRPSLVDWLNNFAVKPVSVSWLPAGSPARAHEGFLAALNDLGNQGAFDEVNKQLLAAGPGKRLLITGHSKGGAVAALAALRFWTLNQTPSSVVTFAAPHAGDRAFADVYNNAQIQHARYEFQDDIVPHAPPAIGGLLAQMQRLPWVGNLLTGLRQFDYEPVGVLRFINWSNQIVGDGAALDLHRLAHIVEVILEEQWPVFRRDHEIQCKAEAGYMSVVCPSGVC